MHLRRSYVISTAFIAIVTIICSSFRSFYDQNGDWDMKLVELFGVESIHVLTHTSEATAYVLDPLKLSKSNDKMLDGVIKIKYEEALDSDQLNALITMLNDTTLYNYKPYLSRTPFAPEMGIQFKHKDRVLTLYYMHDAREITLYVDHESTKYILLKEKNSRLKSSLENIFSEKMMKKLHWEKNN